MTKRKTTRTKAKATPTKRTPEQIAAQDEAKRIVYALIGAKIPDATIMAITGVPRTNLTSMKGAYRSGKAPLRVTIG
jgi:hypothetical protein